MPEERILALLQQTGRTRTWAQFLVNVDVARGRVRRKFYGSRGDYPVLEGVAP